MSVRKVVIAPSGQGAADAVISIALDLGMYEARGVPCEIRYIPGGTVAVAAALGGADVDFGVMPASAAIGQNAMGGSLKLLLGFVATNIFRILVTPEWGRARSLVGTVFGCTARNSQEEAVIRSYLGSLDLRLDRDVGLVELGARDRLWASLTEGSIQGFACTPPLSIKAELAGYRVEKFPGADGPYQLGSFVTSSDLIREQRDVVDRVVRGTLEGISEFKANPDLGIEHIKRWTRVHDDRVALRTYKQFRRELDLPSRFNRDAVVHVLRDSGLPPSAFDDLVDASFLQE